ncbi:sulfotransferase family protein [Bailinhaonella thermotolerans]|uniref:Sulfotransferase family protein n=1 Tax=Bailinhaonella thermotolerans TaxID=1070861 RepID=A0A3A4ANV2_9ACTN|nr:sulfotransferase family protein [Bailinhaonella thermotolerans]RJL31346.1 sulfotransferase family protein [Bailinhaonella thermotolerans]
MLEVIGSGHGRTGTDSLRRALDLLGFGPTYHMKEVIGRPERYRHWIDVARGRPVDWEEVFRGYRSTTDFPAGAYWRPLMERYPDAKVVHTTRDPEEWYESARKTIFRIPLLTRRPVAGPPLRALVTLHPTPRGLFSMMDAVGRDIGMTRFDREGAIAWFVAHNEAVLAGVPADRLLVYDVRQGWEPLCAFLGVPVPDAPFPRGNDAREFRRRFLRVLAGGRMR